jgi:hypothetical protein
MAALQHGKVDRIAAQAGKFVSTIFSANPFGETCGPSSEQHLRDPGCSRISAC